MLNSNALFFVDCQSTGSSPAHSSLLEIAWNDEAFVVNQEAPVPRRITRLIGIDPEEIAAGQELQFIWEQLSIAIERARQTGGNDPIFVAHFARFEKTYLDQLWLKFTDEPFPLQIFCTHKIAKILFPKLPNYGLRALAGWFGTPLDEGKRAAHHVLATRQNCAKLGEELAKKNVLTAEDLASFCEQKPARPQSGRREFLIPRERRLGLPEEPGIYRYLDRSGRVLYVGKVTSLRQRVNSYFTGGCRGDHRKLEMLAQAVDVDVEILPTPLDAGLREYDEIRRLRPPYNISFKGRGHDPESYLKLLSGVFVDRDYEPDLGMIRDVFYGLQDPVLLKDGISLWRSLRGISDKRELTTRELLNMGVPLLRQWIIEERLRRQNTPDSVPEETEDDSGSEDETETEEEVRPMTVPFWI